MDSKFERAMTLLAKAWFSDGNLCTSEEWRKEYFALEKEDKKSPCDGGTCGLGGFCDKCPKLEDENV